MLKNIAWLHELKKRLKSLCNEGTNSGPDTITSFRLYYVYYWQVIQWLIMEITHEPNPQGIGTR